HPALIDLEAGANGLSQGRADPVVHLFRQLFGEPRMTDQWPAERRDPTGLLDQPSDAIEADLGRAVECQRRQGGGLAALDDGVRDAAAEVGSAGDLDLMLQRRLDQDAQQIVILENWAGR